MSDTKLEIAFGEYDRTRVLADGTVKIRGVDASFHSNRIVTKVFEGMIRKRAFDVSELGMTYFLRTMDFEEPPFIAIPIFPNRCFRHSAIYINNSFRPYTCVVTIAHVIYVTGDINLWKEPLDLKNSFRTHAAIVEATELFVKSNESAASQLFSERTKPLHLTLRIANQYGVRLRFVIDGR